MLKLASRLCVVFAVCILMIGCGGGGGGGAAPGGGSGVGGVGGAPITLSQRLAVMQAINLTYQTLTGKDLRADNMTLLKLVQSRKEFSVSGLSVIGGVWARFTDGRML